MASSVVYWTSDGAGDEGGAIAAVLHAWIRHQNDATLVVYGGDIYKNGSRSEFRQFLQQMGGNVELYCEVPGNHDWLTSRTASATGRIPHEYESFWVNNRSKQPVDTSRKG